MSMKSIARLQKNKVNIRKSKSVNPVSKVDILELKKSLGVYAFAANF